MKKIRYIKVDATNVDIAYNLQKNEWPNEPDRGVYVKHYMQNDPKNMDFIAYIDDTPIGITGVYQENKDASSLWLNWFCISPEFRGKGYGRQILLDTIEYCKQLDDIKYLRAESNLRRNRPSTWLYIEEMDFVEKYTIEDTKTKKYGYYICTKCLKENGDYVAWNNKFLNFNDMYDTLRRKS